MTEIMAATVNGATTGITEGSLTEAGTGTGRETRTGWPLNFLCKLLQASVTLSGPLDRTTERMPTVGANTAAVICRHRERDDRKRNRYDDRGGRDSGKKDKKDGDAMSIEETNRMRAELGLKPLK